MSTDVADDTAPFIRPDQALRPGRSDARNLLVLWCFRRSSYPLLFLGLIGSYGLADGSTSVEWSDPGELGRELASPLAGLVLAVVARLVASQGGLLLAYGFARQRDRHLEPRTGVNRRLARLLDLRQASKAFRALRWTHHVRQAALARVAPDGGWWWGIDRFFDIATIVLAIGVALTLLAFGVS